MLTLSVLFYALSAFIGYSIGRITHMHWGYLKTPHHWIYGFILVVSGPFFFYSTLGVTAFCFGTGHLISDFDDFLHLKILSPDEDGPKKFWGID
jgi:hypothetical protein